MNKVENIAWFPPRPKRDHYRGGMPLGCENKLIKEAKKILNLENPKILNLFCGMNKFEVRVDLNPEVNPNYLLDAHICSKELLEREGKFDIILADPPYSNKEAQELYPEVNLPKLSYSLWTYECEKLLNYNGLLIIYHKYIVPNPNWARFKVVKRVFVDTRIMHIPRVAIFFQNYRD